MARRAAGPTAEVEAEAELRRLVEDVARVGELARELQDSAANLISRTSNEEQALRQRAVGLDADLRRLQTSVNAAVRRGGALDAKDADKVEWIREGATVAWKLVLNSFLFAISMFDGDRCFRLLTPSAL